VAVPYTITLVQDSQEESSASTTGVVNTYDVLFTATFPPGADGQPRIYSSELQVAKQGDNVVGRIQQAVEAQLAEVGTIYALGGAPPA
jgi:hypothetical protein